MASPLGDGWLAGGTTIRLGSGVPVAVGAFVDRHLGRPMAGRAETAAVRGEVLALEPVCGRVVRRPVVAVHRAPVPEPLRRVVFGNGAEVTLPAGGGVFVLTQGALTPCRADLLPPDAICVLPRLDPPAGQRADLAGAAARVLGRSPSPVEVAAGFTRGPVGLPLRVDGSFGWLAGVLLAAPTATGGRRPPELAALVADGVAGVFGVRGQPAAAGRCDGGHPTVRRFLDELGLTAATAPDWLHRLDRTELATVLSGVLDAAGTIRPEHRQVVLRMPAATLAGLRRMLHAHGLVSSARSRGGRGELVLTHGDARAAARLARPRRPRLAEQRRALLDRGPGRGPSLGPQPALVAAVLAELDPGGWGGRRRVTRTLAATLGMSERSFYDLLVGRRALHWADLTSLTRLDVAPAGPTVDRLWRLAADGLHPVQVRRVDVVEAATAYAVSLADPVAALLADDVAIVAADAAITGALTAAGTAAAR